MFASLAQEPDTCANCRDPTCDGNQHRIDHTQWKLRNTQQGKARHRRSTQEWNRQGNCATGSTSADYAQRR